MAPVATAPQKSHKTFNRSKPRIIKGLNTKASLIVARTRYIRDSNANTATNMSKLTIAGLPCDEAIIFPIKASTMNTQKA